jgi:hypothetical protein
MGKLMSFEPNLIEINRAARSSFLRDLGRLLADHYRCWCVYHGYEILGVADSLDDAYALAYKNGGNVEEYLVEYIVEQDENEIDEIDLIGK